MGLFSNSTNDHDVKVAEKQANGLAAKTRMECDSREKIELARIALEEKKMEYELKLKMAKLKLEEKQTTLHAETQAAAMNKFLEKGYDAEDFCMAAGIACITLKENHSQEENEVLGNIVQHMITRKQQNGSGGNHQNPSVRSPPPQYNTGGESEDSSEEGTHGRQSQNEILATATR